MQNNIPTVYISEIYNYCCIVKSTNLSTILQFCTKNMKKLKIQEYRVVMATLEREPAFSVGHF
jgi:6-phosphogluconate dehydrogenase